jgi:hypothetical protein
MLWLSSLDFTKALHALSNILVRSVCMKYAIESPAGNSCRDRLPHLECAQILDDDRGAGDPASQQAATQYEP